MKKLLMSLMAVPVISITLPSAVISQTTSKINNNKSLLVKIEPNINKIDWQSKSLYFYYFQIYVNNNNLNNWNNSYNNKILFQLKIGSDLLFFKIIILYDD